MRTCGAAFELPIAQQTAAQLAWETSSVQLDKATEPESRQRYAAEAFGLWGGCGGVMTPS